MPMDLFPYNTVQLNHCVLKAHRPQPDSQIWMFFQKIFSSLVDPNILQFLAFISQGCQKKTLTPWPPLTTKALPCESTPLCTDEIKYYAYFHTVLMRSYVWPHSAKLEAQDSLKPLNVRGITQRKMAYKKNRVQPHWEVGWYHFECPGESHTVQHVIPTQSSREWPALGGERKGQE